MFIHTNQLPKNNKPNYLRICAIFWPQKQYPYRVQLTVGGNLINYQGETYVPTTYIATDKLLLNNFISTNVARFIFIDLSSFYLITTFNNKSDSEYVWLPEWFIPEDITQEYNIKPLIHIRSPTSRPFCLHKTSKTPCWWMLFTHRTHTRTFFHLTRPTTFNIFVDDFGTKFLGKHNTNHLINARKKH